MFPKSVFRASPHHAYGYADGNLRGQSQTAESNLMIGMMENIMSTMASVQSRVVSVEHTQTQLNETLQGLQAYLMSQRGDQEEEVKIPLRK